DVVQQRADGVLAVATPVQHALVDAIHRFERPASHVLQRPQPAADVGFVPRQRLDSHHLTHALSLLPRRRAAARLARTARRTGGGTYRSWPEGPRADPARPRALRPPPRSDRRDAPSPGGARSPTWCALRPAPPASVGWRARSRCP